MRQGHGNRGMMRLPNVYFAVDDNGNKMDADPLKWETLSSQHSSADKWNHSINSSLLARYAYHHRTSDC